MPPRRVQSRGSSRASDQGSAQRSDVPLRGRGQGRRGARIRGGRPLRPLQEILSEAEPSHPQSPEISASSRHETQVETPQVIEEESIAVRLSEFIKLDPPKFSGFDSREEPIEFLEGIEKRCRALRCLDVQYVEFALFRLEGIANAWSKTVPGFQGDRVSLLSWSDFKDLFLKRFLPQSKKDARVKEFLLLKCTSGMSVAEYDRRFTELSSYASTLIPSERDRIGRFIQGLPIHIHDAVAPMLNHFASYADVVDCALRIELRHIEEEGVSKKQKTGNERFQGSSFKGSRPQGQPSSADMRPAPRSYRSSVGIPDSGPKFGGTRPQSGGSQSSYSRPTCNMCGKHHSGVCLKSLGVCYGCGQPGHMKKECPFAQATSSYGSARPSPHPSTFAAPSGGAISASMGRGTSGRPPKKRAQPSGQGQARVYAMTRQDARASNAVVTDSAGNPISPAER